MNCPNCNMPNPDGSEFCLTCGTDLPGAAGASSPDTAGAGGIPANGKCLDCGATNPEDAAFCSLCGRDFRPAAAAASSPAAGADTAPPTPTGLPPALDLMRQAGEEKLSVAQTLDLAKSELAEGHEENAAKVLLEGMRNHPHDRSLRKLFREHFDDRQLRRMNLQVAPVPLWEELGRTLLYPLQGSEWIAVLVGGVVLGLMEFIARYAFFYGIFIFVAVGAYAANVLVRHLKWASVGRPGHPGIVEFHFGDLLYVIASTAATMWPPIVLLIFMFVRIFSVMDINPTGVVITLAMAAATYFIGSFFQPMSLLVASIFNRWTMAFDYSFILRSARVVWKDYLFAWMLLIAVGVVQIVFTAVTKMLPGGAFIPLPVLKWVLQLYNLALLGHVLGRIYYCNEKRLGWFDENASEPKTSPLGFAVMVVGLVAMFGLSHVLLGPGPKTRARRECAAAFAAVRAGKPEEALAHAEAAMRIVPAYAGAHMAKARAYMLKKDYRAALAEAEQAVKLAPEYTGALELRRKIKILKRGGAADGNDGGLTPEEKMQLLVQRKLGQYRGLTMFARPPEMIFDERTRSRKKGRTASRGRGTGSRK